MVRCPNEEALINTKILAITRANYVQTNCKKYDLNSVLWRLGAGVIAYMTFAYSTSEPDAIYTYSLAAIKIADWYYEASADLAKYGQVLTIRTSEEFVIAEGITHETIKQFCYELYMDPHGFTPVVPHVL